MRNSGTIFNENFRRRVLHVRAFEVCEYQTQKGKK